MKTSRLRNVTPFTLDGWPLDALDQETIVELRKLSDQTGWTLAEVMRKMANEYMAKVRAETELKEKIIWLPINAHLRSPPAQR
jgi:hypothetical protein